MSRKLCCSVLILAALRFASSLAAEVNAVVEQPRSFGHVLGDVVTQRVLLGAGGRTFEPAELPTAGRVGVWFERRSTHVERDGAGRRWLTVTYQLMNSPPALAVVTLPAWKLKSRDTKDELRIPEWPISVAPLTPQQPFARAGFGSLRPDRTAALISLEPARRGLWLGIAGLVLCLFAWVGWWAWRGWKASIQQPFAVALREMAAGDSTAPEAWHSLHRAFDHTAGRAIRAETLPQLFQQAPQFLPMRTAIETFFSQSGARFFGGQVPQDPVSVRALCRDLRRIEKRHET